MIISTFDRNLNDGPTLTYLRNGGIKISIHEAGVEKEMLYTDRLFPSFVENMKVEDETYRKNITFTGWISADGKPLPNFFGTLTYEDFGTYKLEGCFNDQFHIEGPGRKEEVGYSVELGEYNSESRLEGEGLREYIDDEDREDDFGTFVDDDLKKAIIKIG